MGRVVSFIDEKFRVAVKNSPCEEEMPADGDTLICYEYEENGYYTKYFLPSEPKIIAGFLSKSDKRKMIANSWDYFVLYADGNSIKESKLASSYMKSLYMELSFYRDRECDLDFLLAKYLGMEE